MRERCRDLKKAFFCFVGRHDHLIYRNRQGQQQNIEQDIFAGNGNRFQLGGMPQRTYFQCIFTGRQFDAVIAGAMQDHCHKTNPRLATRDDYLQMLLSSM